MCWDLPTFCSIHSWEVAVIDALIVSFLKIDLRFLGVVLGLQQNWVENTESSHISLPPHTHSFPYYQHPIVPISETKMTHTHPKPMVYIRGSTLGGVYSAGLDKCVNTGVHHYDAIQNSVTALKVPWAPLHPSPRPWPPPSFHGLPGFAFSRMSRGWNHTEVALSDRLLSLSHICLGFFHVSPWLGNAFV